MTADRRPQRDPRHPDEHFEPYELDASIPWPLLGIAVALGVWGAATLFDTRRHEERAQVERIEDTRLATGQAVEPGHALFEATRARRHPGSLGPNAAGWTRDALVDTATGAIRACVNLSLIHI